MAENVKWQGNFSVIENTKFRKSMKYVIKETPRKSHLNFCLKYAAFQSSFPENIPVQ